MEYIAYLPVIVIGILIVVAIGLYLQNILMKEKLNHPNVIVFKPPRDKKGRFKRYRK